MKIKNVFITGHIHIGKTTILNKVIDTFSHLKIGGFRTVPIYEDGRKKGFLFDTITGTNKIFAHVDLKTENEFDVYKFDVSVFEDIGVLCLEQALLESDLILMDEIGMMEQQTSMFQQMIVKCLNSNKLVIGAFQQRAAWFAKILAERDDTIIFNINEANRNSIADQIIALFELSRKKA